MRIVIVGAGPAGASLALLLARHGAQVRLLEREESAGEAFRGEGLMPLGIDALHEMGLGDVLAAVPGRAVSTWRIHIDGEEVFRIPEPVAELGERAFRVASPAALLERIVDAAREHPGFSYHPGTRFAAPVRDASGRVVGVRAVQPDGETEWLADLVVGCDGRGSSVRQHCDLELERSAEDYDVLWFKCPGPPVARRAPTSTSWWCGAGTRWSPTPPGTTVSSVA